MVALSTPFQEEMGDGVRKRTGSIEQLHHVSVHVGRERRVVRTEGLYCHVTSRWRVGGTTHPFRSV
jgi:hypothetical protein